MAKREYKVRCWVPDASCPGGYRPLESLDPDALAAFRKRNGERMAQALRDCWTAHPEEWRE